ncbi:DUF6929 family protein [Faecalibacter sp. LW9]|uniref:DUF6929 family protein n=1 Tax=Faecalibacter sp. LW9 TaxID=3103144 RepID=UPI002AFFD62F|nr:hypothetical protein [Faecalibacter sp. LW9]
MFHYLLLKILFTLQGLGAASGIVVVDQKVYVVADDRAFLYQYDQKTGMQQNFPFDTAIPIDQMNRKDKLDLESLVHIKGSLYALGSGSKDNRNELHHFDLKQQTMTRYSVAEVYKKLRKAFAIEAKDFNIEGFAYHKGKSYLFNRGNGKNKRNGIFIFEGLPHKTNLSQAVFIPIQLPTIKNELTTFSDAIIVKNKIIFTATIESESTVQKDGEVKESIVGVINRKTFAIEKYHIISEKQKIEGLALQSHSKKGYTFLLCEDNDDALLNHSKIYELKLTNDFDLIQ